MEEPVRSQARLDQTKRLSNAILRRTVVNVVLFMVIYLVLYGGFVTVFGSTVSNAVYELLDYNYTLHTMLASTFMICSAIGFVLGIVLVVRSGINRALRYFDLLLDSVSDILAKSDGPVMLPGELAPTAMALNTIKATSEQNERAAKAAEDRKNELVVYLAHDIKTPLTSIIGYLTLLEESPDLPLEVRERYTGITLDKAYRLEELLDEFFEITRYNLPVSYTHLDVYKRQVSATAKGLKGFVCPAAGGRNGSALIADRLRQPGSSPIFCRYCHEACKRGVVRLRSARFRLQSSYVPFARGSKPA